MRYTSDEFKGSSYNSNKLFFIAILLLLVISTVIIYSVDSRLFPVQFLYIGFALGIFFIFYRMDRIILQGICYGFYLAVALLLLATLVLGVVSKGAIRWLPLGPFTLQASEFAKPAIVLVTASLLVNRTRGFWISLAFLGLMAGLVFIQPDFGTALVVGSAWFGTVLASRIPLSTLLKFAAVVLVTIPLFWFVLLPYQKARIHSFLTPHDVQGTSYQALQSMIAIGSGGVFGMGLGQGSQTQLRFLPARQTDFIFASIGEELGFFGMFLVLVSFFVLFLRILQYRADTRDEFAQTAISGIFFYLLIQTIVNIGMNLGVVPIAGIPLPIISAGGSALVAAMMALGIILALRK